MCSALLPVTAVNDQIRQSCKAAFEPYAAFDSGAGDSVQRSCNLIVKGLLLTCAVLPGFKVPKPLRWEQIKISVMTAGSRCGR